MRDDTGLNQLPFGLVLKWSDGTRLEEVQAMQVARQAGFPVPKVICYGEHPSHPHAPVSILMTRVPGEQLGRVYERLSQVGQKAALSEMKMLLSTMRKWESPWGSERICSVMGTSMRTVRVPNHFVGPCETRREFHAYLMSAALDHSFKSRDAFEEAVVCAKGIEAMSHRTVFTHGDFKHHNILFHNDKISGFVD